MNIRETIEANEKLTFSKYAALSSESKGREVAETPDPVRTCYMQDRDRIIHSHAFRREKDKTQVFIMAKNDHIMNRLSHTLEVTQVATTLAAALGLNVTLTEAMALGHDTAHTCFGHAGERALDKISKEHGLGGYSHAEETYRRLNIISKLNLTYEVLDGIRNHSGLSNHPSAMTLEGQLIPFADKIAYLTSDTENAITVGLIDDFPNFVKEKLGSTKSEIMDTLINAIIEESLGKDHISMREDIYEVFAKFRDYNFENIYCNDLQIEEGNKCESIIRHLFEFFEKHPEKLPEMTEPDNLVQSIIDYIAGMTDTYAVEFFTDFHAKVSR